MKLSYNKKIEAKLLSSSSVKLSGVLSHFKKIIFIPDESSNPIKSILEHEIQILRPLKIVMYH
jgi:hypothetical protein